MSRTVSVQLLCMPLWHAQELHFLLHNAMLKRRVDGLLTVVFCCSMFNTILNQIEETFTTAFALSVG
jgi:hypothetical protein